MSSIALTLALILPFAVLAAEGSPEDAKIRDSIPLGGDFQPNPRVGAFVVLGHGARIIHLFASDDQDRTWKWLAPKGLDASTGRGKLKCNGKLLVMTDPMAANTWTSADAGETWEGPYATGTQRAALSVVNGEFWLRGKRSRASSDGKTWRDLPAAIPEGQVIADDKGTIISIHPQRFNIQRSTDGGTTWQEVHSLVPVEVSNDGMDVARSLPHGHVAAVLGTTHWIGCLRDGCALKTNSRGSNSPRAHCSCMTSVRAITRVASQA